ncbi:hypothetical protein HU200_011360 [Digitaria exilis]|uniref:Nucleotide-diphospho-sugar transferase domain-containing protein n=1 Tax=Digitaria exilis TaxID=1010633 RepID=A0A835FGF4_9POAL|nr:hypothetical protein HU200_011360 [Digitaria exilis]
MEDRTVIITSVNEAWAQPGSLLDIYLERFKNGEEIAHLLNHLLVVALDAGGFERCNVELVWTKLTFQQRDSDMVLFRNPLRHIPVYADMSCSSDVFKPWRAPLDRDFNTGLYYMKATNRTIEMMKYWIASRERFPGEHDQTVFVRIKHELVSELQAKIEPLDTVYFGGFCQYHDDLEKVCTMHACCCVGMENKLHDLKDIAADWKNYTSLTPELREKGGFKWTYPTVCRDSMGLRRTHRPATFGAHT